MMTLGSLINILKTIQEVEELSDDTLVFVDCGTYLAEIEEVDLGGSDEGVIIWCGEAVPEDVVIIRSGAMMHE